MKLQEKELDDDNTSIFKLRSGLRSSVWIENLQQDAKGLVIFSILLMIFRILFIWIFKEQLASNIGVNDYVETL